MSKSHPARKWCMGDTRPQDQGLQGNPPAAFWMLPQRTGLGSSTVCALYRLKLKQELCRLSVVVELKRKSMSIELACLEQNVQGRLGHAGASLSWPGQMRVWAASSAAVLRREAAEAAAAAGMFARGIVGWSCAQETEKISGANLPKKQGDICEYLQPENADGPFQLPGGTTSKRSPQGISAAAVELCLVHSV